MERLNLKNISIKTFTPEDEKKWEEDQKMLKIKEIELRKLDYKMSMGFLKNEKIPSFKEFNPKLQNKNSNSYKEILVYLYKNNIFLFNDEDFNNGEMTPKQLDNYFQNLFISLKPF